MEPLMKALDLYRELRWKRYEAVGIRKMMCFFVLGYFIEFYCHQEEHCKIDKLCIVVRCVKRAVGGDSSLQSLRTATFSASWRQDLPQFTACLCWITRGRSCGSENGRGGAHTSTMLCKVVSKSCWCPTMRQTSNI